MHIENFKTMQIGMSNHFIATNMQGMIVKTPEETDTKLNMYGVYIGRLTSSIPGEGATDNQVSLSSSKCLNSVNKEVGEKTATTSNYVFLTMRPVYNMTMPRLIKGETVDIGLVDQDIKSLYIRPYARDQIKQRPTDILETYVPASGKYDGADLGDDNKYYLRFDSVNKILRIHMSNANGEVSQYDILIDGTGGKIAITDHVRQIVMNTNDDEIYMKNEAESTISMKGDTIEILTNKLFIRAKDEMQFETPKATIKMDNTELTIDKLKAKVDNSEIKGTKLDQNYTSAAFTYSKNDTSCPASTYSGLVSIGGAACVGALAFGAAPGSPPTPLNPGCDKSGAASFAGPTSMPLAKHGPLMALLSVIAAHADAAGAAGPMSIPPMASAAVASMGAAIMSPVVKG